MTTISIPGKITAIEVSNDFAIGLLAGGSVNSKTAVFPSGAPRTVVMTAGDSNTGGAFFFQLDSSFNVGDEVEMYAVVAGHIFAVCDENGRGVLDGVADSANAAAAYRMRKIRSGTDFPTWGVIHSGWV